MSRPLIEQDLLTELPNFPWSLERYHDAISTGILTSDDKVELLFGKLVPMSPIGIQHGRIVNKINRLFTARFPEERYTVGIQNPITLLNDSEPEPDIYLAKGPLESYDHHPYSADLLLVIEVSDSTLKRDRGVKLANYAIAGILEYWIVNVYGLELERYTNPAPEGHYRNKETFHPGDTFSSAHLGDFNVDDIIV